ncbi:MAG: Cna B-type domain-containing protein, partial [Lagierella massiliensis]|nr:Cna B-type domain-containing protein [Lagierella massiliensis]
ELLENGKVKDTVKLNKENNWQHRWESLTSNATWSVIEKSIDKNIYYVKIREDKSGYVITNSYVPTQEPPDNPPKKIPQTGQLWWPIFAFVGIGILSIAIGFVIDKKKGDIHEE